MQKLNLNYLLIGLCFFSMNCLHTVKPNYKIESFESLTRPKAVIGPGSLGGPTLKEMVKKDLSKYIDLTEYSETEKNKIQIVFQEYSPREEDNSYGKIGIFNLCILMPCWKSYESGVKVEYEINGKIERVERYTEDKTLWVWLPFVFYNIFTLSSEIEDYKKTKFLKLLNTIAPNIAKSTLKIENENKSKMAERLQIQNELSEWEKVNKNSVRDLVHYLQNANEGELKDQAKESLNNLLDKKVQTYIVNRYPFIKPYLKNMVLYPDGSSSGYNRSYQFFEIFTRLVLEKNSETGFKQDVKLFQKEGKIIWEIEYEGETHLLYFVSYKSNVTLEKISRDGVTLSLYYQPNGCHGVCRSSHLYGRFTAYPLWKDLDTDFLDSFK
ncbi:hypothetical protein LEP1GSC107_2434 [Leptospira interrogans serovar Grippotyphosa str. UI 12769]|uniref:Lipoprotein n=1 Tax=Leptospira interrogans TaxID=173 RepID=A0AAV9FV40_LEPIR|nr:MULTISPECIES: hypothetical protein [Leptospira]AJR14764.1 hypothetical protein LIL_12162 [Leptospira interrogans serovar Linhai str. 56609]EMN85455.1 hypothetical protein LEP1GSC107_2434 [Leptospira interrogans serovar Grippotyphosa str. UI 12769]KAK2619919.1 hypothetical protein CFV95_013405 [Leptospira interrogans]